MPDITRTNHGHNSDKFRTCPTLEQSRAEQTRMLGVPEKTKKGKG